MYLPSEAEASAFSLAYSMSSFLLSSSQVPPESIWTLDLFHRMALQTSYLSVSRVTPTPSTLASSPARQRDTAIFVLSQQRVRGPPVRLYSAFSISAFLLHTSQQTCRDTLRRTSQLPMRPERLTMRCSEPLRTSRHLLPPPPFHPPCRCRAVLRGR